MAVVKMIGKADNYDIVFEKDSGDQWVATVPFDIDGIYVVELTAYDEAGNESYVAKRLFVIDTKNLVMRLEPLKYDGILIPGNFNCIIMNSKFAFDCEVHRGRFLETIRSQKYYAEVVEIC